MPLLALTEQEVRHWLFKSAAVNGPRQSACGCDTKADLVAAAAVVVVVAASASAPLDAPHN